MISLRPPRRRSSSASSASQWKATRSPLPAATWRSRQLAETFSLPPANHFACGGSDQSRTSSHGSIHSSFSAQLAHHASRVGRGLLVDAGVGDVRLRGELAGGGKVCSVSSSTSSSGPRPPCSSSRSPLTRLGSLAPSLAAILRRWSATRHRRADASVPYAVAVRMRAGSSARLVALTAALWSRLPCRADAGRREPRPGQRLARDGPRLLDARADGDARGPRRAAR